MTLLREDAPCSAKHATQGEAETQGRPREDGCPGRRVHCEAAFGSEAVSVAWKRTKEELARRGVLAWVLRYPEIADAIRLAVEVVKQGDGA